MTQKQQPKEENPLVFLDKVADTIFTALWGWGVWADATLMTHSSTIAYIVFYTCMLLLLIGKFHRSVQRVLT